MVVKKNKRNKGRFPRHIRGGGRKKTVVAVSGGFDPVHIGHVRMFKEAKRLGDELVVILNNDHWLRAKKGYAFMPEDERKEIIESFACVDRVILTGHKKNPKDMSVCAELLSIRPHIFANGGDRKKGNTPEGPVCKSIGCRMIFNMGVGGKVQSSSWLLSDYARLSHLNDETKKFISKKVIAFDLDGTLASSKNPIDREMASLLAPLLKRVFVAVMSGGNVRQFHTQLIEKITASTDFNRFFIFPTCGARMYAYQKRAFRPLYEHDLTATEKEKITGVLKAALKDSGFNKPRRVWGRIIEDRGSQITFSALGQRAPVSAKEAWNKKENIRPKIQGFLKKRLTGYEVRLGGLTSIDITKEGIDKAFGLRKLMKRLRISPSQVVYIGDALEDGGNDAAVLKTGVDTIAVKNPEETKYLLERFLS